MLPPNPSWVIEGDKAVVRGLSFPFYYTCHNHSNFSNEGTQGKVGWARRRDGARLAALLLRGSRLLSL